MILMGSFRGRLGLDASWGYVCMENVDGVRYASYVSVYYVVANQVVYVN